LIDGMNVTAIISLNQATLPAIPSEAIVSHQGQDYIFIVAEDHAHEDHDHPADTIEPHQHGPSNPSEKSGLTFEKIPVARGITDVGYTQVTLLKELPKETEIIVKGAFFVMAKLTNTGEHSH